MAQPPKIVDAAELEFDFEKSNFFRVIHVDGVFGGISPGSNLLHMAIYNERQPLPKKVFHKLDKGVLGQEISLLGGICGQFSPVDARAVLKN